jgi:hypothetical protein
MHVVTGYCQTRLGELRKYAVTGVLGVRYFLSSGSTSDGVNPFLTIEGVSASTYVYYLGGITYNDQIVGSGITTTFVFNSLGTGDTNNFVYEPLIKLESKQNMVENPRVNRDVFIERQQMSVFERNYRLRAVNRLSDVLSYAGGNYFEVYNNT